MVVKPNEDSFGSVNNRMWVSSQIWSKSGTHRSIDPRRIQMYTTIIVLLACKCILKLKYAILN